MAPSGIEQIHFTSGNVHKEQKGPNITLYETVPVAYISNIWTHFLILLNKKKVLDWFIIGHCLDQQQHSVDAVCVSFNTF